MIDIMVKHCPRCDKDIPATREYWYGNKIASDRLSTWCKECTKSYQREYQRQYKKRKNPPRAINVPDGHKECFRCRVILPATVYYFHRNRWRKDGWEASCKKCKGYSYGEPKVNGDVLRSEVYQNNPVFKGNAICSRCGNEYRYDVENFPGIKSRSSGKRQCRNCVRASAKKRRLRYKDQGKTWKDKEAAKLYLMKKRSKDLGVRFNFTKKGWNRSKEYFGGACAVCGKNLFDKFGDTQLSPDHWKPLSKGGESTALNIVPLCHGQGGCNNSKNDTMPDIWLTERYGKRKAKQIVQRIEDYFDWVREQEKVTE